MTIAPAANTTAFAWEDEGTILFAAGGNILSVTEAGGTPQVLVAGVKGSV